MIKRILADIVLFLSIFILPWYWVIVIGIIFAILFKNFWELAVVGFLIDSLYSFSDATFFAKFGIFTLTSVFLVLVLNIFRKKIRF